MEVIALFKHLLFTQKQKPSASTVKNYLADLKQFVAWYEKAYGQAFHPSLLTLEAIEAYKQNKQISTRSIERHLSTLRKFASLMQAHGHLASNPFELEVSSKKSPVDVWALKSFKDHLYTGKASAQTIKNYINDIKQFTDWIAKNMPAAGNNATVVIPSEVEGSSRMTKSNTGTAILTPQLIASYRAYLQYTAGLSPISINRKLSSLRKYVAFLEKAKLIEQLSVSIANISGADYIVKEVTGSTGKELFKENLAQPINPLTYEPANETLSTSVIPTEERPHTMGSPLVGEGSTQTAALSANPLIQTENEKSHQSSTINQQPAKKYSSFPPLRLLQKLGTLATLLFDITVVAGAAFLVEKIQYLHWLVSGKQIFVTSAKNGLGLGQKIKALYSSSEERSDESRSSRPASQQGGQARTINTFSRLINPASENRKLITDNRISSIFHPSHPSFVTLPKHHRVYGHIRHTRPDWYHKYHSYQIVHYFHFAVLVIMMSAMGFAAYRVLIEEPRLNAALAAPPTAPPRILSFQGRLTDANDNPITSAKDLRFAIYDNLTASGSALLWQEVQSITPDADGVFSVYLGSATSIPDNVFREFSGLFLGVTVQTDPELTPRQQIATVAFAANSETLQGLPPITATGAGTSNVVLALDSSGNLTIGGSATPTFQATGGTFTLAGSGLSLVTVSGSNGDVSINPDGSGVINLQKALQNKTLNNNIDSAAGAVEVDDLFAVLATSSGQSAVTINQDGSGPILSASSSGFARFTVSNDGTGTFAGDVAVNGGDLTTTGTALMINMGGASAGRLFLADQDTIAIGGHAGAAYNAISNSGGSPANPNVTSDNDLFVQGDLDVGGTLYVGGEQLTPGALVNYWQRNLGAVAPSNLTNDLLLGSTATSSAKFGLINVAGGTPTATISSNFSIQVPTGTAPAAKINILGGGTLGITTSVGGDSGGTERITLLNNGNVGIGTTAPGVKFEVNGSVRGNQTGALRIDTGSGYVDIGPKNTAFSHFYTDRARYYFDKEIQVGSGIIGSYTGNNLSLATGGTTRITVQDSDGNVGIGKSDPTFKLDVAGAARVRHAVDANLYFSATGSDNSYIASYNDAASAFTNLRLYGSQVLLNPNGGGNVGIGTTSPLAKLDVAGSASLSGNLSFTGAATTVNQLNGGNLNFQSSVGGDAGLTSRLFINGSTGNVGIGTTTPSQALTIGNGGIEIVRANNPFILFDYGGTDVGQLRSNATDRLAITNATGGTEYLTVNTSTGNVGIGTTDPSSFKLEVAGNVGPSAGSTYNLGSSSRQWANIYGVNIYQNGNLVCDSAGNNCPAGSGYWTRSAGVLSPANLNDVLAATTSATRALTITQTGNFDVVRFEDEASDTSPFVIDSTGNVGIGTTAPGAKLQVNGTTKLNVMTGFNTSGFLEFNRADGVDRPFRIETYNDSAAVNNYMKFQVHNGTVGATADVLTLLGNGNVGIGDTTPAQLFVVGSGDPFQVNSGGNAKAPTLALGSATIAPTDRIFSSSTSQAVTNASTYNTVLSTTKTGTLTGTTTSFGLYNSLTNNATDGQFTHTSYGTYNLNQLSNGNTVDTQYGLWSQVQNNSATLSPDSSTTATISAAIRGYAINSAAGTIGTQYGALFDSINNSTGTINNAYGSYSQAYNNIATGTLTTAYGARARAFTNVADASINTAYGLYADVATHSATTTGGINNAYAGYFTIPNPMNNNAYGVYSTVTGTGTGTNYAIYANATGSVTNNFALYSAAGTNYFNGNVGIGITNPALKLHVNGGTDAALASGGYAVLGSTTGANLVMDDNEIMARNNGAATTLHFNADGGTTEIGANTANTIEFNNGQFYMNTGGNIGIGTTGPTGALVDINSSADALRLRAGNTSVASTNNQMLLSYAGGTSYTHAIKTRHMSTADAGNAIDFYLWDYGTDAAGTTGTMHVMSLNGGNVGIGITDPGAKLDVSGAIRTSGQLTSTYNSGAPFVISSSTKVDNLNADLLDGYDSSVLCRSDGTNCPAGSGYWTRTAGVLSPANLNDVLAATTSATRALTITQTGNFDVARFEDELNDATPFVIDSTGNVGIKTTDTSSNALHVAGAITASGATSKLTLGQNPASAGIISIPNNSWLTGRNAANDGDVNIISVNTSNQVAFGAALAAFQLGGTVTGNNQQLSGIGDVTAASSGNNLTGFGQIGTQGTTGFFGQTMTLGTNAASVGQIRIPNNTWLTARNFGNTGDVSLISANTSDQVAFGADVAAFQLGGAITGNSQDITGLDALSAVTGSFSTSVTTPLLTNAGTLSLSATGANMITMSTNGSEAVRIASDGNVGIGTTSTGTHKLTVNGSTSLGVVSQGATTTERFYPNVISAAGNTTVNGAWIIHTPIDRTANRMFRIRVHGYSYSLSESVDFTIVGYPYSGSNGSVDGAAGAVINYNLQDNGTDGWVKHVGVDANGKVAIAFGSHTDSVYYNRLSVDAWITQGTSDYSTGWSIDQSTTSGFGWLDIKGPLTSELKSTVYIKSDGNVGIGQTNPLAKLDVTGDLYLSSGLSTFRTAVSDGTVEATRFCTGDGETNCVTDFASLSAGASYWTRTAGVLSPANLNDVLAATTSATRALTITQTGAFDVARFEDEANDTTPFVIDSSGNVGIGATSPNSKLDIRGGSLRVRGNTAGSHYFDITSTDAVGTILGDNWGSLALATADTSGGTPISRLHIALGGNIGIGTTTPEHKFHLAGTGNQKALMTVSGDGTQDLITASSSGTTRFLVDKTGNVGIGTTSPSSMLSVGSTSQFQVNSTGAIAAATGITSSGTITFSGLTASRAIFTTTGGQLTTTGASADLAASLSNETGTGVAVFGTSPTITTSLVAGSTSFDLINTTATTVNFAGAATTLNMGAGGALTRTINIGTGTGVDTINIGTGGTGADVIAIGSANSGAVTVRSNAALTLAGSTNSVIDFPNFDVAANGNITVATGQGLDTNAAGTLNIGTTTQTGLTLGRAGATTSLIGSNVTAGGIAYGGASNTMTFTGVGTSGQCLKSGATSAPTWGTCGEIGGSGTLNYIPKFTPNGTTLGNSSLFDNGNVGIGTTAPEGILHTNVSYTSGDAVGSYFRTTYAPTANLATYGNGATSALSASVPTGVTLTSNDNHFSALIGRVEKWDAGTVDKMIGIGGAWHRFDAGSVTNFYNLFAARLGQGGGTGTVGTAYGLYIDGQKQSFVTNAYGVYQAGASDLNYFAGNVGIGTTGPSGKLDIRQEDNTLYLGTQVSSGWTNANGIIAFPGPGIRHGQMAFYPNSNAFALLDSSATSAGADQGALSLSLNFSDLWAKNGIFDGNVGIGTTSPTAKLQVSGDSYSLTTNTATKEFSVSFPNGVANQKVDYYMTGTQAFWGTIEVEVTDSYSNQDASGSLKKRFYLGINPSGSIFTNESRYVDEGGKTADNYAISDLSWDATNSRYKITLVHRTSTGNDPIIKITGYSHGDTANFLTFTQGSVYTTDTTVYARPYIHFNNNVGYGTTAPAQKIDVYGGAIWAHSDDDNSSTYSNLHLGEMADSPSSPLYTFQTADVSDRLNIHSNRWGAQYYWTRSSSTGTHNAAHLSSSTGSATYFDLFHSDTDTTYVRLNTGGHSYFNGGNVGIGITNPGAKFAVLGEGTGQIQMGNPGCAVNYAGIWMNQLAQGCNNYNILSSADDQNLYINRPTGNNIYFRMNNGDQMTLNSSGNLGINTTSPLAKLDVRNANILRLGISSSTFTNLPTLATDTSDALQLFAVAATASNTDYRLYIEDDSTDSFSFWGNSCGGGTCNSLASSSAIMTIMGGGNVGIGNTNPQAKLDIGGASSVISNTSGPITITPTTHTIFSSGNVGIGTTNPGQKLDVNGLIKIPAASGVDNASPGIVAYSNDDFLYDSEYINHYGLGWHNLGGGPSGYLSGYYGVDFFAGGAHRMRIQQDGNVGIGTTTPSEKLDVNGRIYIANSTAPATTTNRLYATGGQLYWNGEQLSGNNVVKYKTADETRTSTTTVTDDSHLYFSVGANETWVYRYVLSTFQDTTGGFRFAFTTPSGSTCVYNTAASNTFEENDFIAGVGCSTQNSWSWLNDSAARYEASGTITTGATAGTMRLQWAQRTSSVDTTTLYSNTSYVIAHKLVGADVAEIYYTNDKTVMPGDIVSVDDSLSAGVKKSQKAYDEQMLGIISTQPGQILGDPSRKYEGIPVFLGLSGRVPVKVTTENGPIRAGDFITASSKPGVGMKATRGGQVVGRALEAYDSSDPNAIGYVMVFIQNGYQDLATIDDAGTLSVSGNDVEEFTAWIGTYKAEKNAGFSDVVIARLTAGLTRTRQLIVDGPAEFFGNVQMQALNVASTLQASVINAGTITVNNLSVAGKSLEQYILDVVNNAGIGSTKPTVTNPLASDQVATDVISPLNNNQVEVKGDLKVSKTASSAGNLTVDGTISAQDASIAGTLRAKKIIADEIEGLEARIASIAADRLTATTAAITNIYNITNIASSSATASTSGSVIPSEAEGSSSAGMTFNGSASLMASSIQTEYADIASLSASLAYVPSLNADFATFTQGLMAYGPSSFADISVAGQMSINGSLILAENSINTLGGTLEIQPLRQGNISFMAGLMTLDTDGNLMVGGNAVFAKDVRVNGTLTANIVSPVPDSDLILRLPGSTSMETLAVNRPGIVVQNASGSGVLKITDVGDVIASGAGKFTEIAADSLKVVRGAQADMSLSETVATASAGTATIVSGRFERTIISPFVTEDSLIYITPVSDTGGITPFVARQVAEDSKKGIKGSFTIRMPRILYQDVKVNWWIIN